MTKSETNESAVDHHIAMADACASSSSSTSSVKFSGDGYRLALSMRGEIMVPPPTTLSLLPSVGVGDLRALGMEEAFLRADSECVCRGRCGCRSRCFLAGSASSSGASDCGDLCSSSCFA